MTEPAAVPAGTEPVPRCDLCGSAEHGVLLPEARDRSLRLPGVFSLVGCSGCGLARLSPRPDPDSLPAYYPADSYPPHRPAAVPAGGSARRLAAGRDALRAAMLRTLGYESPSPPPWTRLVPRRLPRRLVRRAAYDWRGFPPWTPGGRALDLGCGNGLFLNCLRRHGWDVVGVDSSPAAAEAARAAFGIDVRVGTVEEVPLEEGGFDFVHMSHAIEHLDRPVETLRRVSRLLRPGGKLYIETPNIGSLAYGWAGQFWFPLDPPRHLWLFSAATLRRALGQCGFSIERMAARVLPSTFKWEATYRREEREGRLLPSRPAVELRAAPRAIALSAAVRAAGRLSPARGDNLACWAERSSRLGPSG